MVGGHRRRHHLSDNFIKSSKYSKELTVPVFVEGGENQNKLQKTTVMKEKTNKDLRKQQQQESEKKNFFFLIDANDQNAVVVIPRKGNPPQRAAGLHLYLNELTLGLV